MKPKVAWFASIAPESSGVAECLRTHLDELFDVRSYAETATGFSSFDTKKKYRCRPGKIPGQIFRALNQVEVPIYHLGGADEHLHTLFLSRRKPGLVILEGCNFGRIIEAVYRAPTADRLTYVRLMDAHYGALGREAANAAWEGKIPDDFMREHFPFTGFAIENALGVIVQSERSFAALREITSVPVFRIPEASEAPSMYVARLKEIVALVPELRLRRVKLELAARVGRTIPAETPSVPGLNAREHFYAQAVCDLLG